LLHPFWKRSFSPRESGRFACAAKSQPAILRAELRLKSLMGNLLSRFLSAPQAQFSQLLAALT